MYATCIFCQGALGANESIEHFPVGRRLAFDASKGRLWVVCTHCQRWNLTPLEERWEAIEEAEGAFRATKLRMSTGQIGLARLKDGTELVRIGAPQRPEMAAWRYGDQLGARRRKHLVWFAYSVASAGAVLVFGPPAGLVSVGLVQPALQWLVPKASGHLRLDDDEGSKVVLTEMGWKNARLVPHEDGDWRLLIGVRTDGGGDAPWWRYDGVGKSEPRELAGAEALRAAALILPRLNEMGAPPSQLREAVSLLEESDAPERLFAAAARRKRGDVPWWKFDPTLPGSGGPVRKGGRKWYADLSLPGHALMHMAPPLRLAMEMAVHEDTERRALAGELAELEAAWRRAEEIAAIADDLLLPDGIRARVGRGG